MVGAADIGIGFGAVRDVAYSVLNNADYAIYTENKLCRLLKEIASKTCAEGQAEAACCDKAEGFGAPGSKTIVISCAGMGTRLGIGTTKALIDVDGKPLIIRQLELLKDFEDVRIVVGYQAERVISLVNEYRRDVLYVFNHNYKGTGTGASFKLGCRYAGELVVALDGDLLVHPDDLRAVLTSDKELVGGCTPSTDNPVLIHAEEDSEGRKMIVYFSRESGEYEWTGLAQIRRDRLPEGTGHVYQLLEPLIPLEMIEIRTKEIDTMADYEHAVNWIRNGYHD
ncbi:MAG: NTP transferase domain-containing protein [Lachnospiraceae bacterium]|nr:NTP transferase domain-containing protein [Lachnospiraceae bacterium]